MATSAAPLPRLTIVVGTKNFSSWSLRPWLVARALQRQGLVELDEQVIALDRPDTKAALAAASPSGLVPVLRIADPAGGEDEVVWESLAIADVLAERFPEARLWPDRPRARAHARSLAAQMHAGFAALRRDMPMDIRGSRPGVGHTPAALADANTVQSLWRAAREQFGAATSEPWLYGRWSIADAMFAPVATRFRTYAAPLDVFAQAYVAATFAHPDMQDWIAAAHAEADDRPPTATPAP
jgi:glutathione S-transferase